MDQAGPGMKVLAPGSQLRGWTGIKQLPTQVGGEAGTRGKLRQNGPAQAEESR